MKLFISSDIEGTAGIAVWEETRKEHPSYEYFQKQMSREVAAACEGALRGNADCGILVRDAHDSACNIIPACLPESVRLMRSWECAPAGMMTGIDTGFDAIAMTGYHSGAYTAGNPLSHTSNTRNQFIRINGEYASEFRINTYYAAYCGVPVIFLSGDRAICEEAQRLVPGITTVPVSEAYGGASISVHPDRAVGMIRDGMERAVQGDPARCRIELPSYYQVEVEFKEYDRAHRGAFYPGARRSGVKRVAYETEDYYEVVRFLYFVL